MPTLYDLGHEFKLLCQMLETEERTPEEEESLAKMFTENDDDTAYKADGYLKVVANYSAQIEAIKSEIDRLKGKVNTATKAKESLLNGVKLYLSSTGKDILFGNIGKFRLQKKPQSVKIINDKIIPEKFFRIIPEKKEIDKATIKDALKAGEEIPGVKMSEPETYVRIY